MKITGNYKGISGDEAWKIVVEHVKDNHEITTVSGLRLSVKFVGSCIFIKGGTPAPKGRKRVNI